MPLQEVTLIPDAQGMGYLPRDCRAARSVFGALTMGTVFVTLIVSAPNARAVENTCRATNLTQETPSRSDLQTAINSAHSGDRISVEGICVGSFTIDNDLTLFGLPTSQGGRPVLHGDWDAKHVLPGDRGAERVLLIGARVMLANLKVTGGVAQLGGEALADESGGGILVMKGGALTLSRSVVRGNRAWYEGGGIANHGRLVLNGSSVTGNSADDGAGNGHGGGIANYGTMIMNGSSSVRGNSAGNTGGGIVNYGELIMNDSSSVLGNTTQLGGGISLSNRHPAHLPDPAVTMNDSSSVRGNEATQEGEGVGGGFFFNEGTVTLNDSSSVSRNSAELGGGLWTSFGTITMNDSSSVTENQAADGGGGIWSGSQGTVALNDSSSVRGNNAVDGVANIFEEPEIDRDKHLSDVPAEEFAALAILILGAIGAGALISRPWLRATALATITGIIGIIVFSSIVGQRPSGPGDQIIDYGYGWFVGVTIGALLAGVVSRLRAAGWPSLEDVRSILGSSLVVLIVLAVPALVLYSGLLVLLGRLM